MINEESLFAAALEKPTAAERQAFLDEACGGDVALRHRLEELLAGHEQAHGILERRQGPGHRGGATVDSPPIEEAPADNATAPESGAPVVEPPPVEEPAAPPANESAPTNQV